MHKAGLLIITSSLMIITVSYGRYTTISDASYGSEPSLNNVLDIVAPVAGGWGSTTDLNTNTNGLRISDNSDQLWNSGTTKVTILGTFWGGTDGPGDTGDQYLRYGSPDGSTLTNLASLDNPGDSGGFQAGESFALGDGGGTYGAWTVESLNSGPIADRAVTFDVTGLDVYAWTAGDMNNPVTSLVSSPFSQAYLVAFEVGGDGDYQDMLFLVEIGRVVPVPSSILLCCSGAIFIGLVRRKQAIAA